MRSALIGHSGFVGSTLLRQSNFSDLYRSTDIGSIRQQSFDLVVCAGAPAQKWLANKDPVNDQKKIQDLISHLETIKCKSFVLISTIDVFHSPQGVDEYSAVEEINLHPYGLNRRHLEKFIQSHFKSHLVVRLPGLVGPRLRKNIIFDLLHNNNLDAIDSRGVFQFYPMVNLWHDIQHAFAKGIQLLHLTAEPVNIETIAKEGFGIEFVQHKTSPYSLYDMRSLYAELTNQSGFYQYTARETIQAVRAYAQSEPLIEKCS